MYHWIYRSPTQQPDAPPLSVGAASGCIFCRAKQSQTPSVGQRIIFLASGDCGQTGVRVDDSEYKLRLDQFAVKMDYELRDHERIVSQYGDLFAIEPFCSPPSWMPPFSIQDVLAIHEGLLKGIDTRQNLGLTLDECVYSIVSACWWQRLPIDGDELWPMLAAHGVVDEERAEVVRLFNFGIRLLIRNHGRQSIKRKRMHPLSKGKYLSKKARNLWLELFGHD